MTTKISPFGIRRAAFIAATPERIWEEFTSLDRMKAWYGTGRELTQYEPRVGGDVETVLGGGGDRARGEVLVFDAGRRVHVRAALDRAGLDGARVGRARQGDDPPDGGGRRDDRRSSSITATT